MDLMKNNSEKCGLWRQLIATITINITTLTFAMTGGWVSPAIINLQNAVTPVSSKPLTDEQISWWVAIMCIGPILLLPFCNKIADSLGRKGTGYLMIIPFIIHWILVLFAKNYIYLLIGRFLIGFGGCLCLFLIPIYVSEISNVTIRGQLGSILTFSVNIGFVIGYIIGGMLSYRACALAAFILPISFLIAFWFMPETPIYLLRQGKHTQAVKSLMWLKNNHKKAVNEELQQLESYILENANTKSVVFKDLVRDRATIRGLIITIILQGTQATCGFYTMLAYVSTIFELSGSSLSPSAATIGVGLIQIFGSWISTMTMERAGRRSLILISCIGMIIPLCILGFYFLFKELNYNVSSFNWTPITALGVYVLSFCLGIGPAPYVVGAEIFSPDVSGLGNSICQIIMWIFLFPIMKFFPIIADALGIYTCFFIFALLSLCTLIFTYFFIPETKGRTIESIVEGLNCVKWQVNRNSFT